MLKFASFALSVLALNPSAIEGFSITSKTRLTTFSTQTAPSFAPRTNLVLNASEGSEASDEAEEVAAELTDEEPKEAAESEADEEPEEEVDEELEAIKKEIAELENTLKNKNRELNSIEKMGEQYTKGGYARKVAEMEQFRKNRVASSADGKVTAKAVALQGFLPVVDELKILTEKYEGDEFAKGYKALSWDFNNFLTEMGVTEYAVAEGEKAEPRRVNAFEEEHSDTVEKGCVIQALDTGFEIDGNVMRMAAAVVSLGSEGEEAAEEGDAEPEADADADAE